MHTSRLPALRGTLSMNRRIIGVRPATYEIDIMKTAAPQRRG
jgi:hypothetical protein